MRLAYAADMHGNSRLYQALLELAVASDAQAVIVGGDLLPHASRIADAIDIQREFITEWLRPLLETFHTSHPSIPVFLLPGNDDWAAAIEALDELEHDQLCRQLHQRVYALTERNGQPAGWIAGYACVPPTPFSIKDYERLDQGSQRASSFSQAFWSRDGEITNITERDIAALPSIADDLAALAQQSDPARTIYVCHTPPANTPLDLMQNQKHVGSPALRAFIDERQPPLTLHGHIHEAPSLSKHYAVQLGRTWSINPGRDASKLHGVTLDTRDITATLRHTIFRATDG